MIRDGLTVENLASACGVTVRTFRNQLSGNFPSRRLRIVLETVTRLDLWSTLAELEARQALISGLGFNPFTLPTRQLWLRLSILKVKGRSSDRSRPAMIRLLETYIQQKPKSTHP